MFARVNIFQGPAEGFEETLRVTREQVLPTLREIEGAAGLIVLGDRETGRSYGITLWRDEAALKASEEAANSLRSDSAQTAGEEIIDVERHEVLLEERW